MEAKLFTRLKDSMSSFNIPEGEFVNQPAHWGGTTKSQVYSMEDQCRVMREIYDYPPKSQARYRMIAYYLQTFCSSFCGVVYDPMSEDAPLVTYTDAEGDMRWFETMLDKMHSRTKEEVTSDDKGTILELFFESELGKEITGITKSVLETKVTD